MYTLNETISDQAGRKLAVYKSTKGKGYTNAKALNEILLNLVIPEYEPKETDKQETNK